MKKYFAVEGNFANAYRLFWTTDNGMYPDAPDYNRKFNTEDFLADHPNAKQITRKEAIRLAREERKRRKENPSFAGYASRYVEPYGAAWYDPTYAYLHTDSSGVVVE